jgi:hypothetical protein
MGRLDQTLRLAATLLVAALSWPAHSASSAWAYAQRSFDSRITGVFSADDSNGAVDAAAGIGFANIVGELDGNRDAAPSGARSRTDFTVVGLDPNTQLTYTWLVEDSRTYTNVRASFGWSALVGVTGRYPFGGSYSLYANLVVQDETGSIGNPNSLVACNGNTRGQPFCSTRMSATDGLWLSVSGLASSGDTGYVEQQVNGDGWNSLFSVSTQLVSVTMLAPPAAATSASADAPFLSATGAYLLWEDGSRFDITYAAPVPEPATALMALVGVAALRLRCARQKRCEAGALA